MALFNMAFDDGDGLESELAAYMRARGVMALRRWDYPDGIYIEFSSRLPLNRAVALANQFLIRRFDCNGHCVNSLDYDVTGKFTMLIIDRSDW